MNIYNVYEIKLWPFKQNVDFTLGNSLFGAVKLTKNADFDKYKYSGYIIIFLLSDDSRFSKNVIKFGADTSPSRRVCNRKKDILILGKGPVQDVDDTTLTREKKYTINFSEQHKKFCLSLHYNDINS